MLQQIRDKTSGLVAGFIVAIIAIPFAFWGVESFNSSGADPVVAKVGDQEIKQSQFQRAYENRYNQLQALMGENFRADMFDQARFRQSVLDDMTQESMLRQHSEDAGYRANDAVLFDYIRQIPAFQRDGKFDTEQYKSALANQGMNPERFEQQLRDSIEIDQMRAAVVETAFVSEAEARIAYQLANQERALSYALFDPAVYLPQVTVADDEVKARYERDKAKYLTPERIKLAYVELARDALPQTEPPAQDVLKVSYDAEKASRFTTQEERKARHILVSFGADKDAAKKKIEGFAAQLKGGGDFAALASANSDDPGSKAGGGDLGWVKRGQMVEKFEKALFALKQGEVSDPVETEFGWHLIKLDELKPSVVRPFEEPSVQQELVELFRNREQAKRFGEMSTRLEQLAFESNAALEPVAKELGLEVKTSDWLTRAGGAGLLANEAVRNAAFSREVMTDGDNSKPIPLGEDRLVVVRKAEYEAPRQRALEEIAEDIRKELREEAAKAKAQADAAAVLAEVKGGKPLADVAAARGVELKSPGLLKRDNTTEDHAILEALFKLGRPAAGQTRYGEARLASGAIAVIALSAVQDPAWPASDVAELERLRQRQREQLAGAEFGGYRKTVEKAVEVEIVKAPESEAPATPEQAPEQ